MYVQLVLEVLYLPVYVCQLAFHIAEYFVLQDKFLCVGLTFFGMVPVLGLYVFQIVEQLEYLVCIIQQVLVALHTVTAILQGRKSGFCLACIVCEFVASVPESGQSFLYGLQDGACLSGHLLVGGLLSVQTAGFLQLTAVVQKTALGFAKDVRTLFQGFALLLDLPVCIL